MLSDVVIAKIDAPTLSPMSDTLLRYRQGLGAGSQGFLGPNPLAVNLVQSVLELAKF